jgi:dTDP-glucose 4,6-dehydratase
MDPSRAERALGWKARRSFEVGLNETLAWYLGNEPWWREVRGRTYSGERLGVGPRQRVTEATP